MLVVVVAVIWKSSLSDLDMNSVVENHCFIYIKISQETILKLYFIVPSKMLFILHSIGAYFHSNTLSYSTNVVKIEHTSNIYF